jgi:hypothetical protein
MKHFGGASYESAQGAAKLADGYVICGYSSSFGNGNFDAYVVKTDLNGNLMWQNTYGGVNNDQGYSIRATLDGNLIICGSTDLTSTSQTGNTNLEFWKIDNFGNIIWQRKFSASGANTRGYSVEQAQDGGYVAAGNTDSSPQGYIVKVDSSGNTLWINQVSNAYFESYDSIAATSDGGYIASSGMQLVKIDAAGNTLWNQFYNDYNNWQSFVKVTSDGGYILSGTNDNYPNYDFLAVKVDAAGNCQWARTWDYTGLGSDDEVYSCMQDLSGNYVFTGVSDNKAAVLKTDSSGNQIWFKKYGTGTQAAQDTGSYVLESADNNYIITGTTYTSGPFGDYFIMKLDPATGNKIW